MYHLVGDLLEAETQDIQQTSLPGQETRFPFPTLSLFLALSQGIHGPPGTSVFPLPKRLVFPSIKWAGSQSPALGRLVLR